jgi:hypothetical protein
VTTTSALRPNMKEARYVAGTSPSYQTCWPRVGLGMKPGSMRPWHLRHDNLLSAILLSFPRSPAANLAGATSLVKRLPGTTNEGIKWRAMSRKPTTFRRRLSRLGPYPSLAIVLIPLAIVEPLKLAALVIAGEGHWLTGTAVLVVAYASSLLIVERLFRLLKPNLMRLQWVERTWSWWQRARGKASSWISHASGRR